jgi:shikimate dehydrogenase
VLICQIARMAHARSSGGPDRTRLGVLGWPVSHSRSPAMQNAALAAAGLSGWRYQALPVPPELFDESVRALPAAGFRGANVTIPHKQAALAVADTASDRARAIGAANTLLFDPDNDSIHAENTDAPAIIEALPAGASGRTALVLGAGGSARAAVWALLDAGAAEVRVWNRTPARATELAAELGATAVRTAEPAELLVHCTSSGLDAQTPMFKGLPVRADDIGGYDCVVDLVYTDSATPLITAALDRGIPAVDGLELLVRQGALSFELFTGRSGPVDLMRAAARGG